MVEVKKPQGRGDVYADLQETRQERRNNELSDDPLPALGEAGTAELEALLDDVGAELLLRKLGVVPIELAHDRTRGLGLAQLQHVLHHVVPEGVLQKGAKESVLVGAGWVWTWLCCVYLRGQGKRCCFQEHRCDT